ncbi:hypothetical protein SAMN05216327_107223 [Dyadobacter sp. SG02]|uniref:hypothetical protein n=1 Tax=Dyadobacter sp. SG02 TaxID=1855291 RepID=UPI0008B85A76|nr:hypothetical protein [Dyadobacter sp. SG02]SEJ22994.1 hypothetical protein SAMN05216327_107223 [Dyadobacter sp. SG02]
MNNLPTFLPAFFIAIVVATWIMLYQATRAPKFMWFLALVWMPVQIALSAKGFYLDTTSLPPHFALAIIPPVLFILYLAVFQRRTLIENSSLKYLTLLHTVRIAVELALLFLFRMGEIPRLMTFEGSNPDILSGITAPLLWIGYRRGIIGHKGLLIWNAACLGLLLNIVVRAILSAPTPFQQFAFDQPNTGLLKAPFVLLPAFIVPAVLFSHVAAILKLAGSNVTSLRDSG